MGRRCHKVLGTVHRGTKAVAQSEVLEGCRVDSKTMGHVIAARGEESRVQVVSVVGQVR